MTGDLFGNVLTDIADGPRVSEQGGITAALMTRLHEKGMTLEQMGGAKIMARSQRTLQAHARELGLAFDDYVPRTLRPRRMMPTVLRRSGPDIWRNGKKTTPRAMVHFCEDCGFDGAGFLVRSGGRLLSYCGWQNGAPVCVQRAKSEAA